MVVGVFNQKRGYFFVLQKKNTAKTHQTTGFRDRRKRPPQAALKSFGLGIHLAQGLCLSEPWAVVTFDEKTSSTNRKRVFFGKKMEEGVKKQEKDVEITLKM